EEQPVRAATELEPVLLLAGARGQPPSDAASVILHDLSQRHVCAAAFSRVVLLLEPWPLRADDRFQVRGFVSLAFNRQAALLHLPFYVCTFANRRRRVAQHDEINVTQLLYS